jgi:outer membrane receptor protein involved in Fe transport
MRSILFSAAASVAWLCVPVVSFVAPARAQEQKTMSFSVSAQPLPGALEEFSRQADVTITASGRLTEGKQSPGFTGVATPIAAIEALLKGTGLLVRDQGGALVIDAAQQTGLLGTVKGQVLQADNQVPLRNVRVSVLGTDLSTNSDRFGRFELSAPAGEYQLRIEHPEYGSQTVPGVKVVADLALELQLTFQPAIPVAAATAEEPSVIEKVEVTAARYAERAVDLERTAAGVVDTIDFEQVARFDDSTISSALTRIVGVSLEEGRYAIVRGMKSRYQSVYFNDAILPNTDPARRDLAMDIFPSSIMEALALRKTASPDVPATATAGHIDMRTKAVPDEPFFKISTSLDVWDDVDDDVLRTEGGDTDWLGRDDGARDLPAALTAIKDVYYRNDGSAEFPLSEQQQIAAAASINHPDINVGESNINGSVDVSGGYRWYFGEQSAGLIGALRYSNKWTNRDIENYRFERVVDLEDGEAVERGSRPSKLYDTWDSNNIVDVSAMLNFVWQPSEAHELGFNNVFLRHTLNSTERTFDSDLTVDASNNIIPNPNDDYSFQYGIDWVEEQLLSNQLWGTHRFDGLRGLTLDWLVMQARGEFDRPDSKRYTWAANDELTSARLRGGSDNNRFEWEGMEEDSSGYRADLSLPGLEAGPVTAALSTGLYLLDREREGYEYSWYYGWQSNPGGDLTLQELESQQPSGLFAPGNMCAGVGNNTCVALQIFGVDPEDDTGWRGDSYLVDQSTDAYYLMADLDFWEKVRANFGVRRERFSVAAEMYEYTPEPLVELLDEEYDLLSAALTYRFNDHWQLRLGYSDTVSWPETFEIMPRTFTNYDTLEQFSGNLNLEPAEIENYDVRLEWYPDEDQSVTLAYYTKDLTNAIENTFLNQGEEYSSYTFDNVSSASVDGWELDLRQVFAFGANHELFVQFSYTDINSEVNLPRDTLEYDPNRPLQGQPDYLINLQLGYDHFATQQKFTVAYSRQGEELAIVTAAEGFTAIRNNVYEQPYDDLKLIYQKGFGSSLTLLLSMDNVLGSQRYLKYDGWDLPYLRYDSGRYAKIKVSYTF